MIEGEVPTAYLKGAGEVGLDPIVQDLKDSINITDSDLTTNPEDIRARYSITDPLVGAALADEVESQSNIGEVEDVQDAVIAYLEGAFDFTVTPPTVVVTPHRKLDSRRDDWLALTVRIPTVDEAGDPISLKDVGLLAEIRRAGPKWHAIVTNGTDSRSGPAIHDVDTPDTGQTFRTVEVLPDEIVASSTYDGVGERRIRTVEWFDPNPQLRRTNNLIDGEDERVVDNVADQVVVEAPGGTYIDYIDDITKELTVNPQVMDGFASDNPDLDTAGITGIAAPEPYVADTLDLEDRLVSRGQNPTFNLVPGRPPVSIPITLDEAIRTVGIWPARRSPSSRGRFGVEMRTRSI
jgi:hypothetical protein